MILHFILYLPYSNRLKVIPMKRTFYIVLLMVVTIIVARAERVDEKKAKQAGSQFLTHRSVTSDRVMPSDLTLVYTGGLNSPDQSGSITQVPAFYVFNISGSQGFVIVSGDDVVIPILGYSDESSFTAENLPPNLAVWLKNYEDQIRFAVSTHLQPTTEIVSGWNSCLSGTFPENFTDAPFRGVNPLISLKWDQSPFYNDLCPYDNQYQDRALTGCVATAMAMVMKYHNYPPSGSGFHSYNHQKYGTLSANFGSTQYNWSAMPNTVTSANTAVATLMYHCGVSVDMGYNVESQGGSGAYVVSGGTPNVPCVENALKTYFGYAPTLQGLTRSNYTESQWTALLKTDLNAGRPIIYAGDGSGGGHCFICDGYNDADYFHFNWGWSGMNDGYYQINALNPGSVGAGGGTGGYNNGQEAVTGIRTPLASGGGSKFFRLNMNAPFISLIDTIFYEDSLSFHTDVYNQGNVTFNGDLCAAIFDTNDVFIDYVEIKKGITLEPGTSLPGGVTFKNGGISALLPGYYYAGIMYSAGDTNWIDVGDTLSYLNYPEIEVVNPNDIEMLSEMIIDPGPLLIQGQPVSVQIDIKNYGGTDFHGTMDLSLYDIDGDYMNSIEEKTNFSLASGASATGLNFSTGSINVQPGDYLLALWYLPSGSEDWQLVGSTDFQNPVRVQVNATPVLADQYEVNNTAVTASALPVIFSGNVAVVQTVNANCHNGLDYDFYSVILPPGYSYMITGELIDSESDTTQTYTLDGIWSYTTDGTNWSGTFDDVMPTTIIIHDGGTITLFISPNFTGETGTYELQLKINRNPLGIGETQTRPITVYPNPVSDILTIQDPTGPGEITECIISGADGRELARIPQGTGEPILRIPVNSLAPGIYLIRIITQSGVVTRSFIKI